MMQPPAAAASAMAPPIRCHAATVIPVCGGAGGAGARARGGGSGAPAVTSGLIMMRGPPPVKGMAQGLGYDVGGRWHAGERAGKVFRRAHMLTPLAALNRASWRGLGAPGLRLGAAGQPYDDHARGPGEQCFSEGVAHRLRSPCRNRFSCSFGCRGNALESKYGR